MESSRLGRAFRERPRGEAAVGPWLNFAYSSWAGPVFLVVTLAGLVLSAIAWSLLPLAAWLTHALGLVGRIVSAIVQFAGAFAFSPRTWLGVILVGVSAVLFLVSG